MITVSVIGCGHMGSALLEGLATVEGYRTIGYDVDPAVLMSNHIVIEQRLTSMQYPILTLLH